MSKLLSTKVRVSFKLVTKNIWMRLWFQNQIWSMRLQQLILSFKWKLTEVLHMIKRIQFYLKQLFLWLTMSLLNNHTFLESQEFMWVSILYLVISRRKLAIIFQKLAFPYQQEHIWIWFSHNLLICSALILNSEFQYFPRIFLIWSLL